MIYLDHNASTPVDPHVLEAMLPYLQDRCGNAASTHRLGRCAMAAVDVAREQLAELLGARPSSLVWTSGATESLNTVLKGLTTQVGVRTRILYGATEHKAVLDPLQWVLRDPRVEVVAVPVSAQGPVDLAALEELVDERTLAVCIMAANNESGALSDIGRIAEIAHEKGALFVCDATQQVGKLPIDLITSDVDFAAVSAHKLYGPQGVGAMIASHVRALKQLQPLIHGGGHQGGLRSGTLNVPGIVGFGAAAELANKGLDEEMARTQRLRTRLEQLLEKNAAPVTIHSQQAPRLPNTTNIRLHGVDADALIVNCPHVAFSSGSACTSSTPTPSHVLTAMGVPAREAEESIRLSLGRFITEADVDKAAELISLAAAHLREVNS